MSRLRAQNVELILARYEGLRIPKMPSAWTRTAAAASTALWGCAAPTASRWEVLWQGEDYCLVRPVGIETTSESPSALHTARRRRGDRLGKTIYTMERWSNEHEHSGKTFSRYGGKTLPPRRSPPGAGPRTSRLSARGKMNDAAACRRRRPSPRASTALGENRVQGDDAEARGERLRRRLCTIGHLSATR